jgi:hypothetical protein
MPVTADSVLSKIMDKQSINGDCLDQCAMPLAKIRMMGSVIDYGTQRIECPIMDGYSSMDVNAMADVIIWETHELETLHEKADQFISRLRDIIRFLIPRVPDVDQVVKKYVKHLIENDPEALQDEIIRHILNTAVEEFNDRSKEKTVCKPA